MRADLSTRVDGSAIESDAGSARGSVRGDLAGVGSEPGRGVFGGDAALQGGAAQLDVLLQQAEIGQRLPRSNADLRHHEVDIRDFFGHRVLDLDARVHLDEDVLAGALAFGVE